jgi:hypothetical protein
MSFVHAVTRVAETTLRQNVIPRDERGGSVSPFAA